MLTGSRKARQVGDVPVLDVEQAGLPGASIVRSAKVATIEPNRIFRKLGSLAEAERASVSASYMGLLRRELMRASRD
jgi:mRNA interferase MazF